MLVFVKMKIDKWGFSVVKFDPQTVKKLPQRAGVYALILCSKDKRGNPN